MNISSLSSLLTRNTPTSNKKRAYRLRRASSSCDETCSASGESFAEYSVSKHVNFDEKSNIYHDDGLVELSNGNNKNSNAYLDSALWYSEEECLKMKEDNAYTLKMVCKTAYAAVMRKTLDACHRHHESCNNDDNHHVILPPSLVQELEHQIQIWSASRIGLEFQVARSASDHQKGFKRQRLAEIVATFSSAAAIDDEYLRQRCLEITRPSALFALHVGRAQEAIP